MGGGVEVALCTIPWPRLAAVAFRFLGDAMALRSP